MLTVLLATRNRAGLLGEVLESFCRLEEPPSGWKLVVVDNGSTDATPRVLSSFHGRLPLQAAHEPQPGKNSALNAGLRLLQGDLAVFTDDDVFPHADWLVHLRRAADAHPAHSIFGGVVVPRWEIPPPRWVGWVDMGPIFTISPPWIREGELPPDLIPLVFGPNMAVRSDVFRSGTRFDPSIGPCGSSYAMGSETELLLRLARQGHRAWHVSGAVTEHFVRAEQLERDWILRRALRWGRGNQRLWPATHYWFGIPRHVFRDLPMEGLAMAAAWVARRERDLFRSHWQFNFLLGHALESWKTANGERAPTKRPPG